ncbi:unnamed protein product [Prorocentrum cordatum]|uniref:Uncharacterized protein n=1 Tax=Prorocentrum cordatum TaxID=2364126 RepID=A0ABN9X828_9DINO|nr:unnamed protein product [Polarella glacialis]
MPPEPIFLGAPIFRGGLHRKHKHSEVSAECAARSARLCPLAAGAVLAQRPHPSRKGRVRGWGSRPERGRAPLGGLAWTRGGGHDVVCFRVTATSPLKSALPSLPLNQWPTTACARKYARAPAGYILAQGGYGVEM